jgi:hypothetical protein
VVYLAKDVNFEKIMDNVSSNANSLPGHTATIETQCANIGLLIAFIFTLAIVFSVYWFARGLFKR